MQVKTMGSFIKYGFFFKFYTCASHYWRSRYEICWHWSSF